MLFLLHVRLRVVLHSRNQRFVPSWPFFEHTRIQNITNSNSIGISLEKMDDIFGVTEYAERKLDAERGLSVDQGDNKSSVEQQQHQAKQDESTDTKPAVSEVENKEQKP